MHVVVRDCCSGDTATSRLGGVRPAVVLPVEAVCAVGAVGPRPKQPPASAGVPFGLFIMVNSGIFSMVSRMHCSNTFKGS